MTVFRRVLIIPKEVRYFRLLSLLTSLQQARKWNSIVVIAARQEK